MTEKKDRDRVMAEITLSHVLRLATEQGSRVSREQALAFLNQEGRAFEMWKRMMQAGEEFIAGTLFEATHKPRVDSRWCLGPHAPEATDRDSCSNKALGSLVVSRADRKLSVGLSDSTDNGLALIQI